MYRPRDVPGGEVFEDARPDPLGLADDDGVGVLQRLVGGERGVESADHDLLAPAAELVGDLVGARRLVRHAGQADDVAGLVEGDLFVQVVLDRHVDARRRQGREVGERHPQQPSRLVLVDRAVGLDAGGLDE